MIDITFFRHLRGERDSDGVKELITKYGAEGYGVYWYILERLYFSYEKRLNMTDVTESVIASYLKISKRKLRKIIKHLEENNLIINEMNSIVSERVNREVKEINEMHERRRKSAKIAGKASAIARKVGA